MITSPAQNQQPVNKIQELEKQQENHLRQITQLQEKLSKLNNATSYLKDNNDTIEFIKFQTKFESDECFKLFKIREVETYLNNTDTLVMSSEKCKSYTGKNFCITPQSWTITRETCMTDLSSYLKTCIEEFKLKNFIPCKSLTQNQLISGNIKQTGIQYAITTSFSSYKCFKEFEIQQTKICWQNTNTQVVLPELLSQCPENKKCLSISPWSIIRADCIEKHNYISICTEEFKENNLNFCKSECDITQNLSGDILDN